MGSKKGFKTAVLLLFAVLLFAVSSSAEEITGQKDEAFEPFVRIDIKEPEAWKDKLSNYRMVYMGTYKFRKVSSKYGIDDIVPNEDGLDELCISGSAQFSLPQFITLSEDLRQAAGDKEIYIIDLRRESHAFIGGVYGAVPVSWYELHNWGNMGLSTEKIEQDEQERFAALKGETVLAYIRDGEQKSEETEVKANIVLTEREIVENAGFHYYRLPIRDHTWPRPEEIDEFVEFVKSIDMDHSWLHFHCYAGSGRTGLFMIIYDKMKNPDISMMDIVVRQTKLGGGYPLYTGKTEEYKIPYYEEKARMTPLLFAYIEDQYKTGYEMPWSKWLEEHEEAQELCKPE